MVKRIIVVVFNLFLWVFSLLGIVLGVEYDNTLLRVGGILLNLVFLSATMENSLRILEERKRKRKKK